VELPAASATLASRLPPSVCCCVVGPLLLLSGGLSTSRPQLWSVAFALQCRNQQSQNPGEKGRG
jgi:hypothetical protein